MSFFGPQGSAQPGRGAQRFTLHQPVSIAIYDSYEDAQHAVDYLADQRFPVSNLSIVGTDLKSIERITGGLNWGKVILTAVMSGVTWGVLAALFVKLLVPSVSFTLALVGAIVIFILANLITSSIGYAMTGGRRDFTSATQVMATRYEILGEAPVANQARSLLSGGGRHGPARSAGEREPSVDHQSWPGTTADHGARQDPDLSAFPPPAWPPQAQAGGRTESSRPPQPPQSASAPSPQQDGQHPAQGQPSGEGRTFDPTDRSQA